MKLGRAMLWLLLAGAGLREGSAQAKDLDLSARVEKLERAVEELQKKSCSQDLPKAPPAGTVVCSLPTPFDGVFSATAKTKAEATDAALARCNEKTKKGIYCRVRDVKCE